MSDPFIGRTSADIRVIVDTVPIVDADASGGWVRNSDGSYSQIAKNGFRMWRAYVPSSGLGARWDQETFFNGYSALGLGIGVTFDVNRMKWRVGTGWVCIEGSDPGEGSWRHKAEEYWLPTHTAVAPDEAVKGGQYAVLYGAPAAHRTLKIPPDAVGADKYGGNAKTFVTVYPILLTGAPNFVGERHFILSGIVDPADGEIKHIASTEPSGVAPNISLSGGPVKALLRNSGAVPADNYLTPGASGYWEATVIYSAADNGWKLTTLSQEGSTGGAGTGSDAGGAGRTYMSTNGFYWRPAHIDWGYTSWLTDLSTAGYMSFAVTRNWEVREWARLSVSNYGIVAFGRTSHEDRVAIGGFDGREDYPGPLNSTDTLAWPDDRSSVFADGPRTPMNTPASANFLVPLSDRNKAAGISLRHHDDMRVGLDMSADLANDTVLFQSVKADTGTIVPLTFLSNGHGQLRVITAAAHGLVSGDWIRGNTSSPHYNKDFVADVINPTTFDCLGSRFRGNGNPSANGTFVKNVKTTTLRIGDGIQQLRFSAIPVLSSDPNILDQYKEAAHLPVLTFSGTTPSDIEYGIRSGGYTINGNRCLFELRMTLTLKGTGGVGNARISVPVLSKAGDGYPCMVNFSNVNATGVGYAAQVIPAQSYLQLYEHITNAPISPIQWGQLTDTTSVFISGQYPIG